MKTKNVELRTITPKGHRKGSGITTGFLAALSFLLPNPLGASEKSLQPPAAAVETAPGYNLQIIKGELIRPGANIEATLANVVDALRDRYTQANIILSPGVSKLKVGDLKLRASGLADELEAVRVACEEKFEVQTPGSLPAGPTAIDPSTGLPLEKPRAISTGLFVLREARPTPESRRVVEAFNIGPYLQWLAHRPPADGKGDPESEGLEEIRQVISRTIQDLRGGSDDADQPKWQYHRGSTLLVVIGTIESVEVAGKIINALPGMAAPGEEKPGRFGVDSPRYESSGGHSTKDRTTEDAFRARYGLPPRSNPNPPAGDSDLNPGPGK